MTCKNLICTILFGLLESSKITIITYFILEIIEAKVTEKSKKKPFSADLVSIIVSTRSLNKIILDESNRPNRIVQINVLNDINSIQKS